MTIDIDESGAREGPRGGVVPAGRGASVPPGTGEERRPGFLRRHRLPLALGVIALCLYAGSILYILYGRGQIA